MKRPPPCAAGPYIVNPLRGYVFYIWQPDIDAVWPPAPTADDDEPHKPGPRPTKNWKQHVVVELVRRIKANEPVPTAPELAQYCVDTLGHHPDLRQIQRLIKPLR